MAQNLPTTVEQNASNQSFDLSAWAKIGDLENPPRAFSQHELATLLTIAMQVTRNNPGRARQIAEFCQTQATKVNAAKIGIRAVYVQAQTHAIRGDFAQALTLIEFAHDQYTAIGEPLLALRTHLGRIHVLNELGRHQEAMQWGHLLLEEVAKNQQIDSAEAKYMATMAHNNLGVCYRRMGQYEKALHAYEAAESYYTIDDRPEYLGDIRNNRGVTLVAMGRVSEALEAFEAAVAVSTAANLQLLQAKSLCNVGEANLYLGNYTNSLKALSKARELLGPLDALSEEYITLAHQADIYLALNLFPEAANAYRESSAGFQSSGMTHYRARALWGLGEALTALSRFEEAEQALVEASALFQAADNIPLLCSVMLERSALRMAQNCREDALAIAQQAYQLVAGNDTWTVSRLYAHLRLVDLLLPDGAAAEKHLLAAQKLERPLALPQLRYRLYQRLGHLRLMQNQKEEAEQALHTAIDEIERLRGNLAQESMRVSFLYDKIAAYEDLLQLYLLYPEQPENVQKAFAVAEQSRSRALVDMLTGIVEPTTAVADPEKAAQLEILQADLNAIYNDFLGGMGGGTEATPSELESRAQTLEQKIKNLRLEGLPASDPFEVVLPLPSIESALGKNTVLLAYHIIGDEIIVFVDNQDGLQVTQRLTTVTVVQSLLQKLVIQWDRFRVGQAFTERHAGQLEKSAQRVLAALHEALIAPIKPLFSSEALVIIPHGLLHQIPFHALYDGSAYLLEQYIISYAPSATVFAICQNRQARPLRQGMIVGVADKLIPAVHRETKLVAQQLPQAQIYLDAEATTAVIQKNVSRYDALHLACHGLFRTDNPLFSALKLGDGWLTAADVLQLDLRGSLVALSACESGRGEVAIGDEVIGLTRAFLGAGAVSLLVSLWLAQDETTVSLMTAWYKGLKKGPIQRARALRDAQLLIKEQHPHPYYWAPFILVGQR